MAVRSAPCSVPPERDPVMTTRVSDQPTTSRNAGTAREWMPHIWQGCEFFAWMKILVRNRFAIGLAYLHVAIIVTFVSLGHTLLHWLQELWFGRAIRRTVLVRPPLFIIGHWRTGTTLLHELLVLDPRHAFPNTYQCLEPNHFLLTERLVKRWFGFLMPSRRPMDNMPVGWDRPQEDEFALCMMGLPSPYADIAFPNRPPTYPGSLDLEGLSVRQLASWKRALKHFLQGLTFRDPRRLVLKSPTHSCRLQVLSELFPGAQFVHIVRNPYVVFPSTINLWKSFYEKQGLQTPTFEGLEEHVFSTFTHLYQKLDEGRGLIPPADFYELRYEDLVKNPIAELKKLYEHLQLGEFEQARPAVEQFLETQAGYQTNRYEQSTALRSKISARWGNIIRKYGYERQE